MLPAASRLTKPHDYASAMRGKRSSRATITCHLAVSQEFVQPRIGFIVNRAVGNSVIRHLVVRRLRHIAREILPLLPANALLVVRAKPAAASASSGLLEHDLMSSIESLVAA
ncbi:MAG TPA: ribonuclease P protein component [Candidatus Nanopelagicaceae bacterium]|nr:ribonuclease P protein component [Candidatus Nanopelagicaceae bacterium]